MSEEVRLEISEETESEIKQWRNKLEEAKSQIDETLSEEEMKKIIKSLQTKEDDIRSIRYAYEDCLSRKQRQRLNEERNKTIGKCYKRTIKRPNDVLYKGTDIFSFKILGNIKDATAECVFLEMKNNCNFAIKRKRLYIWGGISKSIAKRIPIFIDDFEEITEEEFIQLKQEWLDRING